MTADNTAYPIRGQAYEVGVEFVTAATGVPFTGTLTGLASVVSTDRGTATAGAVPVQIAGAQWVYVTLTAAQMTGNVVNVSVSCTNSGVVPRGGVEIKPLDLTAQTTRYDSTTFASVRLERLFIDIHDYLYGRVLKQGALLQVFNALGFLKAQGTVVEGNGGADKSKLL